MTETAAPLLLPGCRRFLLSKIRIVLEGNVVRPVGAHDEAGHDLPDIEAAKAEVLRALQGLEGAREKAALDESMLIEIADEDGQTVANVPLPAGSLHPSTQGSEDEGNDLA